MLKKVLLAAAMSLPLMTMGLSAVSAQTPESDGARVVGLVAGEHGQTLELRTRQGEVDVHWSANTDCFVGGAVADCDAIEPGVLMAAAGSFLGGSNQFQAVVIKARAGAHEAVTVRGQIQSESGQALVVETREGRLVDVTWSDDTVCRTREARIDCERLSRGNLIVAAGRLDAGTLAARVIGVQTPAARPELSRVRGVVTANHGRVLAVETSDGTVNVHFDEETVCQTRVERIDCNSIEERSRVLAVGEELSERNLKAKRIFVATAATDVRPTVRPSEVRPSAIRVTGPVDGAVIE